MEAWRQHRGLKSLAWFKAPCKIHTIYDERSRQVEKGATDTSMQSAKQCVSVSHFICHLNASVPHKISAGIKIKY